MMRTHKLALATMLAGWLALGMSLPASAVEPSEYGWWWKGNQAQARPVVLPVPPYVPEDGLYVAQDPDPNEPLAIAALNYLAPDGISAILELEVVPSSVTGEPLIAACPLTSSFFGEQAGTWEQRPIPNCDLGFTTGELVEDGAVYRVDLSKEFQVFPEVWSFVLFPDDQANPFQIAFERPDEDSFEVNTFNFLPPEPSPGTGTFGPPPTTSGPASTFEPPPVVGTTPTLPPSLSPDDEIILEEDPEPARDGVESAAALPQDVDDTAERILAVGLLLLMTAGLALLGWRGLPSAVTVGAQNGERGLGRFARTRKGRPRRLL